LYNKKPPTPTIPSKIMKNIPPTKAPPSKPQLLDGGLIGVEPI
jgi:hypothetical protein